MLYNIGLISAMHQHELAIGVHMSPPSGTSLPLPTLSHLSRASLMAQLVKNPPAMWDTWVRSLGWEDPLEKGKATYASILAWRVPWTA